MQRARQGWALIARLRTCVYDALACSRKGLRGMRAVRPAGCSGCSCACTERTWRRRRGPGGRPGCRTACGHCRVRPALQAAAAARGGGSSAQDEQRQVPLVALQTALVLCRVLSAAGARRCAQPRGRLRFAPCPRFPGAGLLSGTPPWACPPRPRRSRPPRWAAAWWRCRPLVPPSGPISWPKPACLALQGHPFGQLSGETQLCVPADRHPSQPLWGV